MLPTPVDADELPYDVVNDDDFVGRYLMWLASDAAPLGKPSERLMLETVLGYAASFKEHYIEKYRKQPCPLPFQDKRWSVYLSKMSVIKAAYCFNKGIKLKNNKETATENHLISMISICIWEGKNSHLCRIFNLKIALTTNKKLHCPILFLADEYSV